MVFWVSHEWKTLYIVTYRCGHCRVRSAELNSTRGYDTEEIHLANTVLLRESSGELVRGNLVDAEATAMCEALSYVQTRCHFS